MSFLTFLSDQMWFGKKYSLRKNTPLRFPPHNFLWLYFQVSVSMIMHVRLWAPLLLLVFRCAQTFKHESVLHIIIMTLGVRVHGCVLKSDASFPRALMCPSFLPLKKDKLRTWEGNALSQWLSDIWRGRITVASGEYETFSHSYWHSGMCDWHNGARIH